MRLHDLSQIVGQNLVEREQPGKEHLKGQRDDLHNVSDKNDVEDVTRENRHLP
jgi:hypothetical protein